MLMYDLPLNCVVSPDIKMFSTDCGWLASDVATSTSPSVFGSTVFLRLNRSNETHTLSSPLVNVPLDATIPSVPPYSVLKLTVKFGVAAPGFHVTFAGFISNTTYVSVSLTLVNVIVPPKPSVAISL